MRNIDYIEKIASLSEDKTSFLEGFFDELDRLPQSSKKVVVNHLNKEAVIGPFVNRGLSWLASKLGSTGVRGTIAKELSTAGGKAAGMTGGQLGWAGVKSFGRNILFPTLAFKGGMDVLGGMFGGNKEPTVTMTPAERGGMASQVVPPQNMTTTGQYETLGYQ